MTKFQNMILFRTDPLMQCNKNCCS